MLDLTARFEEHFAGAALPTADEVTNAFWCACHGGQIACAEYLLARGTDRDWIGHDGLTAIDAAPRSDACDVVERLRSRGAHSAQELEQEGHSH